MFSADHDDTRRLYYDHEPAYRSIARRGGTGWDDLDGKNNTDSYDAAHEFLCGRLGDLRPHGTHALDLGCGGGQLSLHMANMGFHCVGVDFSETAIALARKNAEHAGAPVHFLVGDCTTLSGIPDRSFDLAIDNHTLHCLIDERHRHDFLRSAHRVLTSGGLLFSETMSAEGPFDAIALDVDPRARINRSYTRYWTTADELRELFQRSGFQILFQSLRPQPNVPAPGSTIVTVAQRVAADAEPAH